MPNTEYQIPDIDYPNTKYRYTLQNTKYDLLITVDQILIAN